MTSFGMSAPHCISHGKGRLVIQSRMTMRMVKRVKKGRRKRYVRVLPRLNLMAVDAILTRQSSTVDQVEVP